MPSTGQLSSTVQSFDAGEYVPIDDAYRSTGTPASLTASAARMLPSTLFIHSLFRSREGCLSQASSTAASAPRRRDTRSSLVTSAAVHSTFLIWSRGRRRASPNPIPPPTVLPPLLAAGT